ncbi:hypothetical protein GCM10023160_00440 [Brachybacterium paraconglomeratum]
MTDEELLAAVRAGDTGAYAALYRRHLGAALAQARRLVGSHDGQDVAQEAFLKVLRAITGGGGPHDRFAAYLMRVVHNEAVDRLRRTREASVDDVEALEATYSSASAAVTGGEQLDRDLVLTAFSALPQQWQRILWLTEVDGLAPREVAPQLRRSPNAVAQLSRRAREGLRTAWLQAHVDRATVRPECRQVAADLGGYERGQLSAARAEQTTAHLADCVRCSVALGDLRSLSMRMRGVLLPLVLGTPVLLEKFAKVLPLAEEAGGAARRPSWWRSSTAAVGVPAAAAGVAILVGAAGLMLGSQHPGALMTPQEMASPQSAEAAPLEAGAPAAPATPTLLPTLMDEGEEDDEGEASEAGNADHEAPATDAPAPGAGGAGEAADAAPSRAAAPGSSGIGGAPTEPGTAPGSSPEVDGTPAEDAPPAADSQAPVEVPPTLEVPSAVDTPPAPDLVLHPGIAPAPGGSSPSEIVGDPVGVQDAPEPPRPPLLGGTPPPPLNEAPTPVPTPPPPPPPPLLGGGTPPWLPVDPTPQPEDPEVPPEEPEVLPEDPEVPPEDLVPPVEEPSDDYAPGDGAELTGQEETPGEDDAPTQD